MTSRIEPVIKAAAWGILYLILGLLIGFASKWLDLNNEFFGKLLSRIMIWFVICTAIAVYSKRPLNAACNVFAFCIGMLTAYYLVACLWDAVWGKAFMYGWTAFSFCSPVFAFITWYAKGKGAFALLLKLGVMFVSMAAEAVLFGFRWYNVLLLLLLAYILFEKRSWKRANNT